MTRTTPNSLNAIEAKIDAIIKQLEDAKKELRSTLFEKPSKRMEFVNYELGDARELLINLEKEIESRTP